MRDQFDGDVQDFENVDSTKGVYARFYWHPKRNDEKSAEAGRPVFEDREYVEIIAAGNANNIIRRPVTDMDRRRFRASYEKFKQGDNEQLLGTPLAEVTWISRSQVEELAYRKIRTVEQLAEVSDSVCTSLPGLYDLKRKAQAFVQKADAAAPITELQRQNEALQSQLAAMQAQLDELRTKPTTGKKEAA